jgi:choline kinase
VRSKTCIIPVAGEGTRMGGLTESVPKCLLKTANGKTLLKQVVEFWAADRYVVILNNFVSAISAEMDGLDVDWSPIESSEPTLAGSLWLTESVVETPFVIALGDCLFNGEFEQDCLRGVGVKAGTGEFHRSYAVGTNHDGDMTSLIEKPLLGLGCYWFDHSDLIYFRDGGGMEHGLQRAMAKNSFKVNRFTGDYINVTYPEDLENWG